MYGCRVIQKALESIPLEQQKLIIAELEGNINTIFIVLGRFHHFKRSYSGLVPYHSFSYFRKRGEMCERPKWKPRSSEMYRNSRPNVPTIYYRFFQGTGNNAFRYLQCYIISDQFWKQNVHSFQTMTI